LSLKYLLFILSFYLTLHSLQSTAQLPVNQSRVKKPLLFSQVNYQVEIPSSLIEQIFLLKSADTFRLTIGNIQLVGEVIERVVSVPNASTSVNIRINNFKNALFNIILITSKNNVQSIRGRIIHPNYADVLVLEPDNGRYYLRKIEQRLLLAE